MEKPANFDLYTTGGGCMAWRCDVGAYHVLITTDDGTHVPDERGDSVLIGVYDADGEQIAIDCDSATAAIETATTHACGLIAQLFRANINHWLERNEVLEIDTVNRENKGGEFEGCATHDFCDSNMAMSPAFESVMGFELDPSDESHCAIFNQAWDIAKQRGFYLSLFDAIEIEVLRGFDNMTSGLIQGVIGVDDGGFAGMFFSGIPDSEWDSMSGVDKRDTLANYITSEINHNTEIN